MAFEKTGQRYRLLSEVEWEYAARAGSKTAYWWGTKATRDYANYGVDTCCRGGDSLDGFVAGADRWLKTAPVGSFRPNPFGLYDMNGNVWEWVSPCYDNACPLLVARGGGWMHGVANLRSASIASQYSDERSTNAGFRVAKTLR